MLKIVHLTASPFYGGPERVILDIIRTQRENETPLENLVLSFAENGNCEPFLEEVKKAGFEGIRLPHDMPHLIAAKNDLVQILRQRKIDLLFAHGHKARMVGWWAARQVGIPIVGVSHGWTWQDWKVSLYEKIDQWMHRRMDKVVCVSQGQADKVIRCGTPKERVVVIHNAISTARFEQEPDPTYREAILSRFPGEKKPTLLLGGAGRLSPEKGFDVLIRAVEILAQKCADHDFGVVIFGEGFLREPLQEQLLRSTVADRTILFGFTSELDRFLPHLDVFVQSSHTEGLPCVLLEAMAAKVPIVATEVGGTGEVVVPHETGLLVPAADPQRLADALAELLRDPDKRRRMGLAAKEQVERHFTCAEQAKQYGELAETVCRARG